MSNPSKQKGTAFERLIADFLREALQDDQIDRALYESVKPLPFFAQVAEQIVAKGNALPQGEQKLEHEQTEIIETSTGEVA